METFDRYNFSSKPSSNLLLYLYLQINFEEVVSSTSAELQEILLDEINFVC